MNNLELLILGLAQCVYSPTYKYFKTYLVFVSNLVSNLE